MHKLNLKLNPLRTLSDHTTRYCLRNTAAILIHCLNIIAVNSIFSILAASSNLQGIH